jgi:hypothetical protein
MIGLSIDGRAHNTEPGLDTFFSIWHGILYGGFFATALWMGRQVLEAKGSGPWRVSSLPVGYGVGLLGVGMILGGAVVDIGWHEAFGFDDGIKAPFSPPHLVLMTGALLLASTPARALWRDKQVGTSLKDVLTPAISVTICIALVMFYMQYFSPFYRNLAPTTPFATEISTLEDAELTDESRSIVAWLSDLDDGLYPYQHYSSVAGAATLIINNLILMALVLLLVRRYRLPFGLLTLMFTLLAILVVPISDFKDMPAALTLVVGGLAADLLVLRLRPYGSDRAMQFRLLAGLVPLVMWSTYYVIIQVAYGGIAWPEALWSGTIIMCSMAGVGLSLLMAPTPAGLDIQEETSV